MRKNTNTLYKRIMRNVGNVIIQSLNESQDNDIIDCIHRRFRIMVEQGKDIYDIKNELINLSTRLGVNWDIEIEPTDEDDFDCNTYYMDIKDYDTNRLIDSTIL